MLANVAEVANGVYVVDFAAAISTATSSSSAARNRCDDIFERVITFV